MKSKLIRSMSICLIIALLLTTFALPASAASKYTYTTAQVDSLNAEFTQKGSGYYLSEYSSTNKASLVKATQIMLTELGYGKLTVDSVYGPNTKAEVTYFQKLNGLTQDGCMGPKSWSVMIRLYKYALSLQASTTISFASLSTPNTTVGTGVHISGKITSTNSNLAFVSVAVYNASGQKVMTKTANVNTTSYSIYGSALDYAMTFGNLSAGNYTIQYSATTKDGTTKSSSKISFTVTAPVSNNYGSNMKLFSGSQYTNYYVVKGYNDTFRFNQNTYSRFVMNGKNQGCTATSVCMVLSIAKGQVVSPSSYPWHSDGCHWEYCTGVKSQDASSKLRQVADQLIKGRAIALWANENHMVCVIGLKSTANLTNLQASDFLIVDPYNGNVTTLNNAQHGGYAYTTYQFYYAAGY